MARSPHGSRAQATPVLATSRGRGYLADIRTFLSLSQSVSHYQTSYQLSIWSTYTRSVFDECVVESQEQFGLSLSSWRKGDIRHALRPESRVQRCGTLACALRGTAAPRTTLRASEGTHIFRSWHFFFFVLILRGETPERSHTTTSCASGVARPRSTRQAPCTTRAPTTSGARPLRSNRVLPLQKRIKKAHIPVSYR